MESESDAASQIEHPDPTEDEFVPNYNRLSTTMVKDEDAEDAASVVDLDAINEGKCYYIRFFFVYVFLQMVFV